MNKKNDIKCGREAVLDEARICVCGHRKDDYGSPEDSFSVIAQFWNTYLAGKPGREDPGIDAKDVAMMMGLLKVARIATGTGTHDSFVDLAGYAACGGEIADNAPIATPDNTEWMGGGADASVTIKKVFDPFDTIRSFFPKDGFSDVGCWSCYDAPSCRDEIITKTEETATAILNVLLAMDCDVTMEKTENDMYWVIAMPHVYSGDSEVAPSNDPFIAIASCIPELGTERALDSYVTIGGDNNTIYASGEDGAKELVAVLKVMGSEAHVGTCDHTLGTPEELDGWQYIIGGPATPDNTAVPRNDLFHVVINHIPTSPEAGAHYIASEARDCIYAQTSKDVDTLLTVGERLGLCLHSEGCSDGRGNYVIRHIASEDRASTVKLPVTDKPYMDVLSCVPKMGARDTCGICRCGDSGDMILAINEELSNQVADLLEAMGCDICTGYYDPKEEVEHDTLSGLWYVDTNG